MRCTYCYQHDKTPHSMTFETAKKAIDMILASDSRTEKYIQSRNCPGCIIEFIGGEPLLEIDLIDKVTDYFIEQMILLDHPWLNRYRISICSNGLAYFEPKVQEYIKKNRSHLSFTITIDGNKELHDECRLDRAGNPTFDRANAAVQHYNKTYGGRQGTKVTLAPQNVAKTGDALIDFIKNGAEEININCCFEEGWNNEHATILYNGLIKAADYILDNDLQDKVYISILDRPSGEAYGSDRPWCGGSGLMICVDTYGDFYPCLRYAPSSIGHNQKLLKIGDVDGGFVYNQEQQDIIDQFSKVTRTMQCEGTKCADCPISQGCADCAAYNYEVTGQIGKRATFICCMHIARVLAQIYYKNKSFLKTGKKKPLKNNCPEDWAIPIIGKEEYEKLKSLAEEANKE